MFYIFNYRDFYVFSIILTYYVKLKTELIACSNKYLLYLDQYFHCIMYNAHVCAGLCIKVISKQQYWFHG